MRRNAQIKGELFFVYHVIQMRNSDRYVNREKIEKPILIHFDPKTLSNYLIQLAKYLNECSKLFCIFRAIRFYPQRNYKWSRRSEILSSTLKCVNLIGIYNSQNQTFSGLLVLNGPAFHLKILNIKFENCMKFACIIVWKLKFSIRSMKSLQFHGTLIMKLKSEFQIYVAFDTLSNIYKIF